MSHQDSSSKLEIATHASLPLWLMLLIQTTLNYYAPPAANTIFISPYLLAFFVTTAIAFVVLWKGQICPGQKGRLTFILPFLLIFALGNYLYSVGFTPKHTPLLISGFCAMLIPCLFWKLPDDEQLRNIILYCGLGICAIGAIQYLAVYWVELPSLFNGVRANNFAQIQLGILLAGWYLILANSRLEVFLKLLVQITAIVLVLNYIWTIFVLYQHLQIIPNLSLFPYIVYFIVQFLILAMLAWLLLAKKEKAIKNPIAWTLATFLAMLYPLINMV